MVLQLQLQPLPIVDIVAEAAKLQEAMARGAQKAQQARAPESRGDAGQGGTITAAQAYAEGEVDRGGANDATGRTSKSGPVGMTRIAPPGRSREKGKQVGARRNAPPAK